MHETAVAESILKTIIENAERVKARPTRALVSCGQFNTLNDEIMTFAFETAAAGTICEGMTLQIKHIPLRATCNQCGVSFEFDVYKPHCPQCEQDKYDFLPDAPLLLETIEFED